MSHNKVKHCGQALAAFNYGYKGISNEKLCFIFNSVFKPGFEKQPAPNHVVVFGNKSVQHDLVRLNQMKTGSS